MCQGSHDCFPNILSQKSLKRRTWRNLEPFCSERLKARFPPLSPFPSAKMGLAPSTSLGSGDWEMNSLVRSLFFLKRCVSLQSNLIIGGVPHVIIGGSGPAQG